MPALRGEWESVFSGRHTDNVPKETHVVSVMTPLASGTEVVAVARDEKDDRLLPHPNSKAKRTAGEEHKSSQKSGNRT